MFSMEVAEPVSTEHELKKNENITGNCSNIRVF